MYQRNLETSLHLQEAIMSQSAAVRTTSSTNAGTDQPVDLWVELERLSREDRVMLARRREDVRLHRLARRNALSIAV
jgi:hypothetical protein